MNDALLTENYKSYSIDIEKTPLADNYIYISHLEGLDGDLRFWFLPFYPESVSDSMQSTFAETTALGRTAPVYTFGHSGPRTVQVNMQLHREMVDDLNSGKGGTELDLGEDYVDNLIHALQSIAVPKYNLYNKAVEPPLVALKLGEEIFIKGVVTSGIGVTYTKPILYNNKYAQVAISFTIAEVDPYDATSVFKNGSYRDAVKTLAAPWIGKGENNGYSKK